MKTSFTHFLQGCFIFCLLQIVFSQTAAAQCSGVNEQDSLALVAIYEATDGENWNNNKHWLTGNVRDWIGVQVTENGCRVKKLNLNNNKLIGYIPPEIGQLTELTSLNLNSNFLRGSIPPQIGKLRKLTFFTAQQQQLCGIIPPEIGRLRQLTALYLDRNQLSGTIPPEIGKLTKLKWLKLNRNQLSGSIPSEIGNLTELNMLWLFSNNLSGSIPPEIGNLTKLWHLHLSNNKLSGCIPTTLQVFCENPAKKRLYENPNLATQDFQEFCAFGTGMCDEPPAVEPVSLQPSFDTLQVTVTHITNTTAYQLQFNKPLAYVPQLHLFNIMGQPMGSINTTQVTFDKASSSLYLNNLLANYPSGMYLLQVEYEGIILGAQLVR